jgi:hypothetical protein
MSGAEKNEVKSNTLAMEKNCFLAETRDAMAPK